VKLRNVSRLGLLAVATFGWMVPRAGYAQVWEVGFAWVEVDHDYPSTMADTGEQVPVGFGISARRSFKIPSLYLEFEYTRGAEERAGAICGGFIQPGDCVLEQVEYSGGVSMLSMGWLGDRALTDSWSVGIRPEMGIGFLRANEAGRETGKTYRDWQVAASFGLGLEVGYRLSVSSPITLAAIAGWNHLRPVLVERCDDCRLTFRRPLPQISFGLAVRWGQY
jgi:hypothetical protein